MPAHRKPISILSASGATAKNPQRFRERMDEPVPTSKLGAPPKHLPDAVKSAWKEIVKQAAPGTLFNTDRIALEVAATMLVRFRAGEFSKASEVSTLVSLLARFGMTPADRAKVSAAPTDTSQKEKDEWDFTTSSRVRAKG